LHPPLLSALIRSLSDLLIKRNGVAVIATHSPVVLQEVPNSCVWKLERSGGIAVAERPRIETFGENVGTLTSEVFKLEVTSAGFHKLLTEAVRKEQGDYQHIMRRFGNQLGAEARAIVRGLAAIYRNKEDDL
jgi:predicted ATP-binding protein involved in virulence